jgi:RHS repeat-associated protein
MDLQLLDCKRDLALKPRWRSRIQRAESRQVRRRFDATYGELSGIAHSRSGASLYSAAYVRDTLGRVIQKSETIGGVTQTADYTYDAAGRLATETRAGVTTTWGYDLNGNRITQNGAAAGTVDAQDRFSPTGASYTYTDAGALATKPGATYIWDTFGNLTQATVSGTAVSYKYDSQQRRVGRSSTSNSTQYLYDGQLRVVAEINNGTQLRRFIYGSKAHVPEMMFEGQVGSNTFAKYRIISDQLGSVRLVIRLSDGVTVSRMDYDAWGKLLPSSTPLTVAQPGAQPFGFAGGLYDAHTGFTHFGARDYDPALGRWISKDPIRFDGGYNLYAYCEADPVNCVDRNGRFPQWVSNSLDWVTGSTGGAASAGFSNGGGGFGGAGGG